MEGVGVRRRVGWSREEDDELCNYISINGAENWDTVARNIGRGRSGNSCRLRWMNYLSPSIRRGEFTHDETLLIIKYHSLLGSRWSRIAQHLSGRTDNDIKNFWNTRMKKEAKILNLDDGSPEFHQIMTERIQAAAAASSSSAALSNEFLFSNQELNYDLSDIADPPAAYAPTLVAAASSLTTTDIAAANYTRDLSSNDDEDYECYNLASIWSSPPSFGKW